jgi:hypothetical protein
VVLSVYREPPLVDLTSPAPRELRVVEPVTVNVPVMEVEAKLVRPETVKAVAEAVVRLVWPLPQRMPETEMEVRPEPLVPLVYRLPELE